MEVMLARLSSRSIRMGYLEILHFIKVSLIKGHAFFGFAVLCFLVLIVLTIVYGDIRSYELDVKHNIMRGESRDMDRDTFDRYRLIRKTILGVFCFNAIAGTILYHLWKNQSCPA